MILLTDQSWAGSIPTWLLLLMAALAAWKISRGGGGTAVTELTKANEFLTEQLGRERKKVLELEERVRILERRTDFSVVMSSHEKHAHERHEALLRTLDAITDRLKEGG